MNTPLPINDPRNDTPNRNVSVSYLRSLQEKVMDVDPQAVEQAWSALCVEAVSVSIQPHEFREVMVGAGFSQRDAAKIEILLLDLDTCWEFAGLGDTTVTFTDAFNRALKRRIEELVREAQEDGGISDKLLELCKLGYAAEVDPEEYRVLLVAAGLPKVRASEIKIILMNPAVCDGFLAGETWAKSLAMARSQCEDGLKYDGGLLVHKLNQAPNPARELGKGWVLLRDTNGQYRLSNDAVGVIEILRRRFKSV